MKFLSLPSLATTCIRGVRIAAALFAAGVAVQVGAPDARGAADVDEVEYGIKAAYLFNFTKFIDWPESAFAGADAPFVIGVIDPEGVAAAVVQEVFRDKSTGSRPIVVRVFAQPGPDLTDCHLVFLARSAADQLSAVRRLVDRQSILLVGESQQFAQRGGAINLVTVSDAVRCEINLRRSQQAGLTMSGRLASVARLVRDVEIE